MAAPRRPASGRRSGRRRVPPTRRGRTYFALCCWSIAILLPGASGCAWWREARDSVAYSQGLYQRALEHETRGEHPEAVRLLRGSIAAKPDDPELRWELARILIEHGETPEALQELRFLVKNYPDDSRAYITLARTLLERGRAEDAAHLVNLAIDLDSRSTEARLLRAQIAEARADFALAFETYHHLLLEQPELVDVRLRLASLEIEQGEPRIAAAFLRETLTEVPLDPEQARTAQWLLGTAYAHEERWSEAAATLALGIPREQATIRQHYELAYACCQAGDRERARREIAVILHAEPKFIAAHELLAELDSKQPQRRSSRAPILPTAHAQ